MTSRLSALAIASLLALPSLSAEAVSAVRLRCDDNNAGAKVFINGKPKGECPVDLFLEPGATQIRVVKADGGEYERVWERSLDLADGVSQRFDVELSAPRLTAAAAREREVRAAAQAQADAKAALQAAERGDVAAMDDIASRLDGGRGVAVDKAAAAQWRARAEAARAAQRQAALQAEARASLQAAERGDVGAMDDTASRFETGRGVAADPKQAAEWRARAEAQRAQLRLTAAERGDEAAMAEMIDRYTQGRGVPQSAEKAAQWRAKVAAVERRRAVDARRAVLLKQKEETKILGWSLGIPAKLNASDTPSTMSTLGFLYSPIFTLVELVLTAPSQSTELWKINRELNSLPSAWAKPDSMIGTAFARRDEAPAPGPTVVAARP